MYSGDVVLDGDVQHSKCKSDCNTNHRRFQDFMRLPRFDSHPHTTGCELAQGKSCANPAPQHGSMAAWFKGRDMCESTLPRRSNRALLLLQVLHPPSCLCNMDRRGRDETTTLKA